jgi:hypothetical protein
MANLLTEDLKNLLLDQGTTAVLATLDAEAFPHAVAGVQVLADEAGNLLYLEYLESSDSNKNLVRSIWFDRKVSVAVRGLDGRSYQVKGRPTHVHITGPVFLKHYQAVREAQGDVNLAAVWVIEPEQVINESLAVGRQAEQEQRPFFTHLDRLVR